jgi:hypothetical protein
MTPRVVREKNTVMSPAGLGTKNDCAGEDHQGFTRPTEMQLQDFQSGETVKYGHDSRGTRDQERLCWRGPAAIYPTKMQFHYFQSGEAEKYGHESRGTRNQE